MAHPFTHAPVTQAHRLYLFFVYNPTQMSKSVIYIYLIHSVKTVMNTNKIFPAKCSEAFQ